MATCENRPHSKSSEASKATKCTAARYRPTSRESFVDETLFRPPSKVEVKGRLRSQDESVTISRDQFEEMMAPAPVLSVEETQALRKQQEKSQQLARQLASQRKQKILEMEEARKKQEIKTESEILKEQEDKATTRRAKQLLEEQLDDVKRMNQMVLYAKCAALREKQVKEKQESLEKEKKEQRRLDHLMEVDRVKAVQSTEEAEKLKVESRRAGARVIERQLQEREEQRQREAEVRRRETEAVTRKIEQVKQEDAAVLQGRKATTDQMMKEVAIANREQIRRKEEAKLQEKEEEMRILEYIRQRDAREQEEMLAKERLAKEKELETARLRAQQERMADKQAELDELRARRYQEMKEKEWRQKELDSRKQKEQAMTLLAKARESQKAAKTRQLGDMARIEQEEFYRVLEVSKAKAAEEAQQEALQKEARLKYKEELETQVASNDASRRKSKEQESVECRQQKEQLEIEKAKILRIKDKKIQQLHEIGIPEKYIAELARTKIEN